MRPYVLLSCCMSLDGYISGPTDTRLILSGPADLARVDAVRASCDAILVGAGTVRRDNPRLLVRATGQPTPTKVTLTASNDLDPAAAFFSTGPDVPKIVYSCDPGPATRRLGAVASVVDCGSPVDLDRLTADLAGRGIRRLMVEGGASVHTLFLTAGIADELHLVVAPVFVGDSRARRFVGDGAFPTDARLVEVRPIDDVVLLRYALSDRFEENP